MPMTLGNQLYMYALLSREIGVGRQTGLARVEEVLAADDLMPCDVDCADVRELMEALDFVKLTVFKRGRVYATVLERPEWDELLRQAASASDKKPAATAGGHKSWRRKRGAKALRPERPRPHGRPTEVAEVTGPERADDAAPATPDAVAPDDAETYDGSELVAKEEPAKEEPGGAPTVEGTPAVEAGPAAEVALAAMDMPGTETVATEASEASTTTDAPAETEARAATGAPAETASTADAGHDTDLAIAGAPAESPLAEEPAREEAGEAPAIPSGGGISFTVTYDPATDETPSPETAPQAEPQAEPERPAPSVVPTSEHPSRTEATKRPARAYRAPANPIPHDFATEVWCPNEQLSKLYQVLPLDVNPLTMLAEDWAVARSTQAYERTVAGIVYPLRCLSASAGPDADASDATPVRVTIRRRPANSAGKRWQLVGIDGDFDEILADFSVLRSADEGAWADLDGLPDGTFRPTSPLRDLAGFALIGSLPERLAELARLAEPEPWGNDLAGLRDYLAVTFERVQHEHKVAIAADGSRAAFDTGLFATTGERIFACFETCRGDVAWKLMGFFADCGLDEPPEPASYVSAWEDLCLAAPYDVHLSRALRRTYAHTLDDAIARSVLRARRSHRVATPAWDPQVDELRLLLPLDIEQVGTTDAALVLARRGDEGYEARAILSLDRARTCARIVTSELPSWLA